MYDYMVLSGVCYSMFTFYSFKKIRRTLCKINQPTTYYAYYIFTVLHYTYSPNYSGCNDIAVMKFLN